MAKHNYLISGLAGTGKSSVYETLLAQGFNAVDADSTLATQHPTGWLWDHDQFWRLIKDKQDDALFICGSATNRDEFIDFFDKIFILCVDDDTLKHRLEQRQNNNFGKDPLILAKLLSNNQGVKAYSLKRGRIVIDATQPIHTVVDAILKNIG